MVSASAPVRSNVTVSDACSPAARVPAVGDVVNFDDDTAVVNDTGNELGLNTTTFTAVELAPKSSFVLDT